MAIFYLCLLFFFVAISNTEGACQDRLSNCNQYPTDDCTTYKQWAKLNCPKTCKICTADRHCPPQWSYSRSDNTCFKVFKDLTKNWYDARDVCKENSGDLVIIKDEQKNSFVSQLLSNDFFYWIGLKNVDRTSGISFKYVDGSTLTSYTKWNGQQPDNYEGKEHCVVLAPTYGGWSDISCLKEKPFICQKNAY